MTQEEKQLLAKDLCIRLLYGVFVHTWYNKPLDIKCTGIDLYTNTINLDIPDDDNAKVYIDNCKPYLRPIYSMTEEENSYFHNFKYWILKGDVEHCTINMVDWLNAHHFDYRGLIEMGLAIEAPEGMYH